MATNSRRMAATAATALFLCLLVYGIEAQSPAAAPGGDDCFPALANMSDCLSFVVEGSKLKKPDKGCCGELAGLVESNPICLCQLLADPVFAGMTLDLNRALQLPSVCGVSTPPVSTCNDAGVPVSLPPSSGNVNPPSSGNVNPPPPMGAAPAPAGGGECFPALANMSDCLAFVEEGSKQKKPEKACCGELAGLVDSNPICLCQLLANPVFAGIKLDLNKSLELPSLCDVTTPPISACSAAGVPVSLPPSSSVNPPSPTPAGSETSPPGNGVTSINPSGLPFVLGLLATIFL